MTISMTNRRYIFLYLKTATGVQKLRCRILGLRDNGIFYARPDRSGEFFISL